MRKRVIELNNMAGMDTTMQEPEINNEASNYIEDNYEYVVGIARKMGVDPDKVYDLVNDVYVSIVQAERSGHGYDMNGGKDGRFIQVDEFVFGRLKGYSKNVKYQPGKGKSAEVPATAWEMDGDENYHLDSFQASYLMAANDIDEIAEIDEYNSIKEQIEFCRAYDSEIGFPILNLFKNISAFTDKVIDKSLFNQLRNTASTCAEFSEALQSVLTYAKSHRDEYNCIVAGIKA